MAHYVQFTVADGNSLLVEVEDSETFSQSGVQKAGLQDIANKTVAAAQTTFEQAMQQIIYYNARTFLQSINSLPVAPNEAEITFGLKVTGELGNVAVAKVGGETNYNITLIWKKEANDGKQSNH